VQTSDRTSVLDDVRQALGHRATVTPEPLDPFIEPAFAPGADSLIARFTQEATAVSARVHRLSGKLELVEKILEMCAHQAGEVALSGAALITQMELGATLAARGLTTFESHETDHEALISRLANSAVGVTAADYAIAETGTIVLTSDEPNALLVSLLPPVHIALVRAGQVVASIDETIIRLSKDRMEGVNPSRSVTMITGPSRTSDVELILSIGVHGPKELHVIILDESPELDPGK
jgi:L-lactate dehydrogenase complex protein LldG